MVSACVQMSHPPKGQGYSEKATGDKLQQKLGRTKCSSQDGSYYTTYTRYTTSSYAGIEPEHTNHDVSTPASTQGSASAKADVSKFYISCTNIRTLQPARFSISLHARNGINDGKHDLNRHFCFDFKLSYVLNLFFFGHGHEYLDDSLFFPSDEGKRIERCHEVTILLEMLSRNG